VDKLNISFKKIQSLFKEYSFLDIYNTLFCLSIFLPNTSSTAKQLFLTAILITINEDEFSTQDKIINYTEFSVLFKKILELTPNFPQLEDYFPETDWGEIKFYHHKKLYKIFYGGELENTYDFLEAFKITHCSLENEYEKSIKRSPNEDLSSFLELQNLIINTIEQEVYDDRDFNLGQLILPDEGFWKQCINFINNLNVLLIFTQDNIKHYSTSLGTENIYIKNNNNFVEGFYSGQIVKNSFIKNANKYYPLLPRRFTITLIEHWDELLARTYKKRDNDVIFKLLNSNIALYIQQRIDFDEPFFENVKILSDKPEINNLIFNVIPYKNNLLLFNLINSATSDKNTDEDVQEINNLATEIKESLIKNEFKFFNQKNQILQLKKSSKLLANDINITIISVNVADNIIPSFIGFTEKPQMKFFSLADFLQIIDRTKSLEEFVKKLSYLDKFSDANIMSISSEADKIAYFDLNNEHNHLTGIEKHNTIVWPSYSTNARYNELEEFWVKYPDITLNTNPRCWYVEESRLPKITLVNKSFLGWINYLQINKTSISIFPLFNDYNKNQIRTLSTLTDMIEDTLAENLLIVKEHSFFKTEKELQIMVIPYSLIKENPQFKHLQHFQLNPDKLWEMDRAYPAKNVKGIRIVYDDARLIEVLTEPKDRRIEIELTKDVLRQINIYESCIKYTDINKQLTELQNEPARFYYSFEKKITSFPEYWKVIEPEDKDFIIVKNKMAEFLYELNIRPGSYDLDKAKYILNELKIKMIEFIDTEIKKFSLNRSISYLIQQFDALCNKNEQEQKRIKISMNHEVDYDRVQALVKNKTQYSRSSANYRYLLNKFVQLSPNGPMKMQEGNLKSLLAISDWIKIIYDYSDTIHYNLLSVGITIKPNYIIETDMDEAHNQIGNRYESIHAKYFLKNFQDDIKIENIDLFHINLDSSFVKDFGFSFNLLINTLSMLSKWSYFNDNVEDTTFYAVPDDEIIKQIALKLENITESEKNQLPRVIRFLTLSKDEVSKIYASNYKDIEEYGDIPINEHNKRFSRYIIRPLIRIDNKTLIWGPYSAYKAMGAWGLHLSCPKLPFNLPGSQTKKFFDTEKQKLEKQLVQKTFNIICKNTTFIEKELELHKRDKRGNHPVTLGDYDILCYLPKQNIVFNIECKYHVPVFCAKDAKTLYEKIYDKDKNGKSSIDKVINREKYLKDNYTQIFDILKWQCPSVIPSFKSIYLTRDISLWAFLGEANKNIQFLSIVELKDFLNKL